MRVHGMRSTFGQSMMEIICNADAFVDTIGSRSAKVVACQDPGSRVRGLSSAKHLWYRVAGLGADGLARDDQLGSIGPG